MPWKHAFIKNDKAKKKKKNPKELLKYFYLQTHFLLPWRILFFFFFIHLYFFEAKTRGGKFDEIVQMTVWDLKFERTVLPVDRAPK